MNLNRLLERASTGYDPGVERHQHGDQDGPFRRLVEHLASHGRQEIPDCGECQWLRAEYRASRSPG